MPTPTFGFWIADAVGSNHTLDDASKVRLVPGPVEVDYPTGPLGDELETVDGRVVLQQPSKDGRRRQWIWRNIPAWLPGFTTLWHTLERSRSRYRLERGLSPYVYLLDSETHELSVDAAWSDGSNGVVREEGWVRCRVLGATRIIRPGGDVVYAEIRLRFVIDDPNHRYFG
jgi:hypothetical protein